MSGTVRNKVSVQAAVNEQRSGRVKLDVLETHHIGPCKPVRILYKVSGYDFIAQVGFSGQLL